MIRLINKGKKIFERVVTIDSWWHSHTMAPSALYMGDQVIRIYLGCWDAKGISRIGYVDVDAENPQNIINVSQQPVLEIGRDGSFDENGVFPAHVAHVHGQIYLYYTGFQLGHKIRHYNFGGLAISDDKGLSFKRYSEAPILDRADEGLLVRAGQSILIENDIFRTCYSAGSNWRDVGGRLRPTYDIYYQDSPDGVNYQKHGRKILSCNPQVEHGLGRPQLVKFADRYYVFYTRRILNMKYAFGCAVSDDCISWERVDEDLAIKHPETGFDSEMIYFPSFVFANDVGKAYIFYCGNDFGRTGLGFFEVVL